MCMYVYKLNKVGLNYLIDKDNYITHLDVALKSNFEPILCHYKQTDTWLIKRCSLFFFWIIKNALEPMLEMFKFKIGWGKKRKEGKKPLEFGVL